jgi:hypothetical protein
MFSRYISVSEHRTMYLLEMWDGIKVKCANKSKAEVCPVTVYEGSEFLSRFFLRRLWSEAGWSTPRCGRYTPGKESRYALCRRLFGPQGRSVRVWKISSPPGFEPRTALPISGLCRD